MNGLLSLFRRKHWFFSLFVLALPVVTFCAILIPREINILKVFSVLTRYNSTRFVPIIGLLLLGALSIKNQHLSITLTTMIVFPVFALALNGLWAGAYSENNVVAGLIPRTDALSFYGSAVSLKEVGYLVSYTKRRPLFGGFLALLLWITSGNLQIALAITAFLLAVATLFSIMEVRRMLNPFSAVIYFIVLFLFVRRHIGITMSENMGLLLGISAFSLFLVFLQSKENEAQKIKALLTGSVFIYTLAQVSRPGAMATLPFLILFSGWIFRENKKWSWKWMTIITLVILLGFLINAAIFRLTTLPGGSQANNVGFGIYGLVVGGKGWEQIFIDHPELDLLSGRDYERAVFRFIWEELSSQPGNFIRGMFVQFKTLFSFAKANSIYSFVWSKNQLFSNFLIAVLYLLSLCGLIFTPINKDRNVSIVLFVFGVGFLASLPVAPAYQTRHMRVYAASIPLLAFLPAAGSFYLINYLPKKISTSPIFLSGSIKENNRGNVVFSGLLLAIILIGPLLVKMQSDNQKPVSPSCGAEQDAVVIAYYPGSSIKIFRNNPIITTWVPNITQLDYKGSIHNICCGPEISYFKNISVPTVMVPSVNLLTDKLVYMLVKEDKLPQDYGRLQICGRIENVHEERSESGFLYPATIQLVE